MRSRSLFCLLMLFSVLALYPLSLSAADGQETWRQRASAETNQVGTADVAEEIRFGREIAARLIGRFGLYENPALTKYINLVGRSLERNSNRPEIQYHFAVLNTNEINGYAAPGGYVFVTRGAIEKMKDEAELAAVLGHEMTHISERHVVKELHIQSSEVSAASGLARLIGGGTQSAGVAFYQAVDKALDMLFKTGYGREDEIQADRGAVLLSALAGYDPSALERYFERIAPVKGEATATLDKTHPPFSERIAWLKDMITDEGIDTDSLRGYKDRFAEVQKSMN